MLPAGGGSYDTFSVYFADSKPQDGPATYSPASSSPGEFSEVEDDGELPF